MGKQMGDTMYYRTIKGAKPVAEEDVTHLRETVRSILDEVGKKGDSALRYYEKKFDNFDPPSFRITPEQAAGARDELPADVREELDFAISQVSAFARAQKWRRLTKRSGRACAWGSVSFRWIPAAVTSRPAAIPVLRRPLCR